MKSLLILFPEEVVGKWPGRELGGMPCLSQQTGFAIGAVLRYTSAILDPLLMRQSTT